MLTVLLSIVVLCLFGQTLSSHCDIFCEFQTALLSADWMLLVCLAIWCGSLIFLTFSRRDWLLTGLLLIAIVAYFIRYAAQPTLDAIILLTGVTLGRGTRLALGADGKWGEPFRKRKAEPRQKIIPL